MSYTGIISMMVVVDAVIIVLFLLFFPLTYYLSQTDPYTRRYAWLSIIFLIGAVGWLYYYAWSDYQDAWNYLHQGDAYVQVATCTVRDRTGTTGGRILLGKEDVRCWDGREFETRFNYRVDYPRENETYLFYYLPKSHIIVHIEPRLKP